jgi:dihydroxyacid dehydratase/phosphogluconate dehydratase
MSLPGCAAIPAPHRERAQISYASGKRIVDMVNENLKPSQIMTRKAFENAIVVASAIGASSNGPPHLAAIARHMGVEVTLDDWQAIGHDIPLLVNCQPAGIYLGEDFHRVGGVPVIARELLRVGKLHGDALTVTGRTLAENYAKAPAPDGDVIRTYEKPMKEKAGFLVISGNLFDSAVMKTSVIDPEFRKRYLSKPGQENTCEGRAIVFDGPEDYHAHIDDPELGIDENCILFIRGCGPVGYPGSAEVVNMSPPAALIKRGITALPCVGDGRQSGTSGSPSILNVSPEAAVGGGLALLNTGDRVRIDMNKRRLDVLISDDELKRRRAAWKPPQLVNQTPWQEIYRSQVGQLATGGCLEPATLYLDVIETKGSPRHSH